MSELNTPQDREPVGEITTPDPVVIEFLQSVKASLMESLKVVDSALTQALSGGQDQS